MTILLAAYGSRGDVQPFLALALALQQAGRAVKLAAPQVFADWVQAYGVAFAPVRFDPQNVALHRIFRLRNPFRFLREMRTLMWQESQPVFEDFWQASAGTEAVICQTVATGGVDCAEGRRIPCLCVQQLPLGPTRAFRLIGTPPAPPIFSGAYNRLTHAFFEYLVWQFTAHAVNRWRQQTLGLAPIPRRGFYPTLRQRRIPQLLAYSPALIPKPDDWPAWYHVTGFWELPAPPGWQPPADLARFIDSGPPPVFIGFGSMQDENPAALTSLAVEALALAGQRGVLYSGWAGLATEHLPKTVFGIQGAPFNWLFPRMAAVVHHGGAGTTATGLTAGVPNIITPFIADQFGWAMLLHELGLTPQWTPVRQLTAAKLAAAIIQAVSDPELRHCAAALGARLHAEDGLGQAVAVIERYLG
jgi:UDP:flavonoid glycosyltransferase YjiC (YdhE family)